MMIILRTRCGCEKIVDKGHDGHFHRMPLVYPHKTLQAFLDDSGAEFAVRTFKWEGERDNARGLRVYVEVLENHDLVEVDDGIEKTERVIELD